MQLYAKKSPWSFPMLSNKDKKLFNQFASMVHEKFPTANIWAYGSRVRGDATVESDLDVCVVVDKLDDESDSAIMEIAWQIGFENDVIMSTVTYSKEEFEDGPCSESGLVQNILGYGIAA
jgi:predicted nucleotidyltransferase